MNTAALGLKLNKDEPPVDAIIDAFPPSITAFFSICADVLVDIDIRQIRTTTYFISI